MCWKRFTFCEYASKMSLQNACVRTVPARHFDTRVSVGGRRVCRLICDSESPKIAFFVRKVFRNVSVRFANNFSISVSFVEKWAVSKCAMCRWFKVLWKLRPHRNRTTEAYGRSHHFWSDESAPILKKNLKELFQIFDLNLFCTKGWILSPVIVWVS